MALVCIATMLMSFLLMHSPTAEVKGSHEQVDINKPATPVRYNGCKTKPTAPVRYIGCKTKSVRA